MSHQYSGVASATMSIAVLLVAAAALWQRTTGGNQIVSMATGVGIACPAKNISIEADYHVWRSVRVQVANWSVMCTVRLILDTSSVRRPSGDAQLLLLLKVQRFRLSSPNYTLYLSPTSKSYRHILNCRFCSNCSEVHCDFDYLWANESVELNLNASQSTGVLPSYEATFIATKATNVCGLASRTGELLVETGDSSQYAFAPDTRTTKRSPYDVACIPDAEYSLTVRSRNASAALTVTSVDCPENRSCVTLLLNGFRCRKGEKLLASQPGSNVTLQYVRHGNCYNNNSRFAGFVVSAEVAASRELPLLTEATNSTTGPLSPSNESDVMASQTKVELPFWNTESCIVVSAIVGTLSAAAVVISLILMFRARRVLIAQLQPQHAFSITEEAGGRRCGDSQFPEDGYEPLRAINSDQHVYGEMVLSSA